MKKRLLLFLTVFLFLIACTNKNKSDEVSNTSSIITKQHYEINPVTGDSIQPVVNSLGQTLNSGTPLAIQLKVIETDSFQAVSKPIQVNPKTVPTNTNIHLVKTPKVTTMNTDSLVRIPIVKGKSGSVVNSNGDTIQTGIPIAVTGRVLQAQPPEIVVAKDAYINNDNSAGFSVFSKLQGLKHSSVFTMLEDQKGNLWIGTSGGVSKYDGETFTHYTEKEGLSNDKVRSILEDSKGNLWFGTNDGITKYDGEFFTQFTEEHGLTNNIIRSILEDKNGNLWFGTYGGGVSKFIPSPDGNGGTFTHFTTNEGLSNDIVLSLIEDQKGNIWMGTSKGVTIINFKHQLPVEFVHFPIKEGVANNGIRSLLEDKKGNIWLGSAEGLFKYTTTNKGKKESITQYTENEGLTNNMVLTILEDNNEDLWIGTWGGGVSKFVSTSEGEKFINFTENEGLSNNKVWSILEDKSGNLWLGTYGGGVNKHDGETFTHFTEKEGLSSNVIWSILEDKKENLWFGTNGGGISKYDGNSFTHFTKNEGLTDNSIFSMLEDQRGNLWLGTNGAGVTKLSLSEDGNGGTMMHFTTKEGLSHDIVRTILEDKNGNIWLGTNGGGATKYEPSKSGKKATLSYFTEEEGLSSNAIFSMIEDSKGNLWFGTNGGGVTRLSPSKDGTAGTIMYFTEKEGLSNNVVRTILEDKNGNIWLGTNGGVSRFEPSSDGLHGTFTHFTEKEGLSNNFVFSICEDKDENLWLGTRFGLTVLIKDKSQKTHDKDDKTRFSDFLIRQYSYDDGLYGIGVNGGKTILQDSKSIIWVGSNDRLTKINIESDLFKEFEPPKIELSSISLFNEQIIWFNLKNNQDSVLTLQNGIKVSDFEFDGISKWNNLPQNLSLAYNNNSLTFKFIGITMHQPKKVRYRYMLEGFDQNWSGITDKNEAQYGNLPHGKYTFKVKAIDSNGEWSNVYQYSFTIRPPWWKTNWAYTMYIILFIITLWGFVNIQTRRLKKRQKELELKVDNATEEIRAQKNRIEKQKERVESAHKEITDSINYAERIQRSFLATEELLNDHLEEYFVFFQPKDVVSGDFYWAGQLSNNNFAIVNADSTGHGVPGAIMSILNISAIESAVKDELTNPAAIFNETRKIIIERLKKDGSLEGGKDGMDASLLSFNADKTKMSYVAANNPIWIVRAGELIDIKPEKMPVGKHDHDHIPFVGGEFELQKGDVIYTLTDGFQDQFGGENLPTGKQGGKKFKVKPFKQLIIDNAHLTMQEQEALLKTTFNEWKGNLEQVDDVCVVGIRV